MTVAIEPLMFAYAVQTINK